MLCTTDTTDGEGNMLLQASTAATRTNSRLYRQLRNYVVRAEIIPAPVADDNSSFVYSFYTLPDTWFVRGAIRYAYETYMAAHQDELAAGIKFSRWHDFMINEQNVDAVWEYSQAALWDGGPDDGGWATLSADEALSDSSVTDSGGTSKGFHLLGNLANSFNIFREYANKLKYQVSSDESVSSDQPYEGLMDLEDADDMAEKGDQRPYDSDWSSFLPDDTTVDDDQGQNILVHQASIAFDVNAPGGKSTPYFTAPLGLVWVRKHANGAESAFSTTAPELVLELQAGKYKGVKAPSLV